MLLLLCCNLYFNFILLSVRSSSVYSRFGYFFDVLSSPSTNTNTTTTTTTTFLWTERSMWWVASSQVGLVVGKKLNLCTTSGGRSGTRSCWWMVDQIYAESQIPFRLQLQLLTTITTTTATNATTTTGGPKQIKKLRSEDAADVINTHCCTWWLQLALVRSTIRRSLELA